MKYVTFDMFKVSLLLFWSKKLKASCFVAKVTFSVKKMKKTDLRLINEGMVETRLLIDLYVSM